MKTKNDNGQAGLEILLAIITMVFAIGMLVMIFVIMSGKMMDTDSIYTSSTNTINSELITTSNTTGTNLSVVNYRGVGCSIRLVSNNTNDVNISNGGGTETNFTQIGCLINGNGYLTGESWNVSYSYTFLTDGGAIASINKTSNAVAGVTDWFSIILIISCMVVLILLTVIIISAIKGVNGGGAGRSGNSGQGTA